MALRLSSGLKLGIMGTSTIKEMLNGGVLDLFTGSQPASSDYIETGTKLVRISTSAGTHATAGLLFGTSSSTGTLPKSASDWKGTVSVGGIAGWFRFYGTGGTTGTSGTARRVDGAIGVSGADLNLTHTSLDKDSTLTVNTFSLTQPTE